MTALPTMTLSDVHDEQPTFVAPVGPTSLTFEVAVDDGGLTSTDQVVVTVRPPADHFTDVDGEDSLELSWEEIEHAAEGLGLRCLRSESRGSGYCVTRASMSQGAYNCVFSVFKKSN